MNALNLILNQIKELLMFEDGNNDALSTKSGSKRLFVVDYSDSRSDMFSGASVEEFSGEDLEQYLKDKELKEAKENAVSSLSSLLSSGALDEKAFDEIQDLLKGDLDEENIKTIQKLVDCPNNKPGAHTITKDKNQISEILDSMSVGTKDGIIEQAGGIESIESVCEFENGAIQINTKDNLTITTYPSGKYICSYNDIKRTGFDVYDENNKIESSTYIDHVRHDNVVKENYAYKEEEGGFTKTIDNSVEPDIQKIVDVSAENEITSVKTLNKKTGEITVNFDSKAPCEGNNSQGTENSISSANSELSSLQEERSEVQEDLTGQQSTYEQTQSSKTSELGAIDSQIGTEEGNLCGANSDLDGANSNVCDAKATADSAQNDLNCSQKNTDCKQGALEQATGTAQAAQGAECAAKEDNVGKVAEEQQAQGAAQEAQDGYNAAAADAQGAQVVAQGTGADLAAAVVETKTAFNVRNQKQAEVDAAQSEYNSAQAAKNNGDQSLWQKFKNWVSSAWNKLTDAISGRDAAAREAEEKQREEERARAINQEAQDALKQREEEQDKALDVSQKAQVVLDRKTGEREVSDQEYADALLDLADAMLAKNDASKEYDSALEQYKETYNYKVDADGDLINAEGEKVSCEQVVQELEAFVQGLYANREDKETKYDSTLEATAAVISGDETKLAALDNEIAQLEEKIAREEEQLAMQEQMVAALAAEKGELNAAEDSVGIGDDIAGIFGGGNKPAQEDFQNKQEMLEKALVSGNPEDIKNAYKAIYGDNEVVVDASGNIVDPSTLSEEELQTCSVAKVSDLSEENITAKMQAESTAAVNASALISAVDTGTFVVDGQTVTMDQLNSALAAQAQTLIEDMENAVERQGAISKFVGGVNNVLGIGTSESEARAQVEHYKAMVERLNSCTDPKEYAALYKAITGSDFDAQNMVCLLAYNSMTNPDSAANTSTAPVSAPVPGQTDLSEAINEIRNNVNELADGNPDALLLTDNSKASESIQDYIATQETAKDAVIGVATGIITAVAVAAAPFTGGASLLLAAGVGAAVSVGLNAADSIYDKDGDGSLNFNYTAQDALKDGAIGALNGMVGTVANGAGAAVTKAIGTSAAKTAVTTTFSQAVQKTCLTVGSKLAGAAVEGAIDGGISSGGAYVIEAITNEDVDFSFETLAQVTGQGAAFGSVFNVGLSATGQLASGAYRFVKSAGLEDDINRALIEGTSGNAVADMIAGKLDDGLKIDGQVNHYAVSQLMTNAENSLNALAKLGLSENAAMKVLNDIPLETQAYLPKVIDTLKANNIIPGGQSYSAESVSNIFGKLDDVQINKRGDLTSMNLVDVDGVNLSFEFDAKGKLISGLATNPDGSTVKIEYAADGSIVMTKTPGANPQNPDALGLPAPDDAVNANYKAYNADVPAADAPAGNVQGVHVDADPVGDVDIPPVDVPAADAPAGNVRRIYAKDIIQQSVENDGLDQVDWKFLLDDEYARIRETGAYAVNYGADGFEDALEKVQAAIDPNDATGMYHNGVLVYDGGGTHWVYRGSAGDCVERLSVNVKASADMIEELDAFMTTGRYIDSNGQLVQVDDVTKFCYKTPQNAAAWNNRQDPLTFYFGDEVNEQTYNAIAEITGRHARGAVNNANPNMSWISAVEKNPTVDMVNELADQLQKYSQTLARELRSHIKRGDVNMSSGEFIAFENMLRYFKEAAKAA